MLTIADVTKLLNLKSKNTLRNWTVEFGEYLSTHAHPPKGNVRLFDDSDIEILHTVHALKVEYQTTETIHAALTDGERIPLPARPEPTPGDALGQPGSALVTKLTATVANFEGQLTTITNERDRRITERDKAQAAVQLAQVAIRGAEIRAATAETRADILQARIDETKAKTAVPESRPSWWQRLRGKE